MSVLEEIVAHKRMELIGIKQECPLEDLIGRIPRESPASFTTAIGGPELNIIAEIKYRSPTHGPFACDLPATEVAALYSENGAAAVSVLTDRKYFSGDLEFLRSIHQDQPGLPLLRKDFVVDPYQVLESRINGASACLLIVACLSEGELRSLICQAEDLGCVPLVEVHDPGELDLALGGGARLIGVNNRDLASFRVDLATSFDIARRMEGEEDHLLVSESGISEISQILELRDAGFSAFLIGSILMDSEDPARKLRELRGEGS